MKLDSPYLHQINVSAGGVPKHAVPEVRITVEGLSGDCSPSCRRRETALAAAAGR